MQPILARLLLRASALAFTGIGGAFLVAPSAMGRFVSWAVVGPPGTLGLALHGAELLAIVAGLLCLRRLPA